MDMRIPGLNLLYSTSVPGSSTEDQSLNDSTDADSRIDAPEQSSEGTGVTGNADITPFILAHSEKSRHDVDEGQEENHCESMEAPVDHRERNGDDSIAIADAIDVALGGSSEESDDDENEEAGENERYKLFRHYEQMTNGFLAPRQIVRTMQSR